MKTALLLGNGINRAIDNNGWCDLLRNLAQEYDCVLPENATVSNLPLEFERIYSAAAKRNEGILEEDIIERIREYIPRINDFTLWREFTALPVKHILTANYDYNIEMAIASPNFSAKSVRDRTKEIKYSLFRRIIVNDQRIWHIHGEANYRNSICLGYDFYCRYLAEIQKFVNNWEENTHNSAESWVSVFLRRNVHIAGLAMSFIEIDLWWLLSYWARMRNKPWRGRIHYYYPEHSGNKNCTFDEQLHLLESFGVELHPIHLHGHHWREYYRDVVNKIKMLL